MPEPLKNMYSAAFFETLCPVLKKCIPGFDCRDFTFQVFNNQWPDFELKERVRHIAVTLHNFLPKDFEKASKILIQLSNELKEIVHEQGFAVIFIPEYIQLYGLDHPSIALDAIEKITQLVSAEFAIRPFIIQHEKQTMKKMLEWSTHIEPSVRRLSSEGCRPRLPWAMALPEFKKNPEAVLSILENLKEDASEYVQRSIANNLNDIAKDHPQLVLKIAKRWRGKNPNTDWIIKHGCRTLLKKGDTAALSLHGFNHAHKAKVQELVLEKKKVKIGEHLFFHFNFSNLEKKPADFRLEYSIDYITSTDKTSRKVFKITENSFAPGEKALINRKQSFKDFTTRKHFKGKHYLSILANGKKLATTEFMVC
jgi:3-methyladenine DNA glycosylase AlkC